MYETSESEQLAHYLILMMSNMENGTSINRITSKGLSGKIAIVTASTKGIGYGIAERLAQEGAKVIISSRKEEHVTEATKNLRDQGLNVKGIVCHVSKAADRQKLFEAAQEFGGLDILVSNAAVNPARGPLFDCSEAAWDKTFDVNVKASFFLTKEALPLLRQSKTGRVIYISSVAAYFPYENLGVYATTKMALCALAKSAAVQLGPENITVNSIAPGLIKTDFSKFMWEDEENEREFISGIPLRRCGTPADVSAIVAFLASDNGSYITGENIAVCGGAPSRL